MTVAPNILLHVARGEAEAALLCTLLQGCGVSCRTEREALLAAHLFNDRGQGEVRLYVAADDEAEAREILRAVEAGELALEAPDGEDTPRERWRDLA